MSGILDETKEILLNAIVVWAVTDCEIITVINRLAKKYELSNKSNQPRGHFKYLGRAESIDNALFLYSLNNPNATASTNDENKTDSNNYSCICGASLIKCLPSTSTNTYCDICYQLCSPNAYIYHCNKQNVDKHPDGYDVCDNCKTKIGSTTSATYANLVNMGFSADDAIIALQHSKGDFDGALQYLAQFMTDDPDSDDIPSPVANEKQITNIRRCNGSIKDCVHFERIHTVLQQYNSNIVPDDKHNITQTINDFNHLLYDHGSDNDFDYIHHQVGKCDISECNITRRYYNNRKLNGNNTQNTVQIDIDDLKNDTTKVYYFEIIDKIHCYFAHSYDMGYRFTLQEKQKINMNVNDNNSNQRIVEIKKIMKEKQQIIAKYGNSDAKSKFNQLEYHFKSYSFGQLFYYWDYYKNNDDNDPFNIGYKYSDWYISPRFNSLKTELTQNSIQTVSVPEFQTCYSKTTAFMQTEFVQLIFAYRELEDGMPKELQRYNDVNIHKISKGTPISMNHLIAVSIYCNFSQLQYKFSETFRRLDADQSTDQQSDDRAGIVLIENMEEYRKKYINQESDKLLKVRHSNFYHLARYITEAVNIYYAAKSTYYQGKGRIWTFYHGVNKQMIFDSMRFTMHQPFSTSSALEVAFRFSNKTGMVFEMKSEYSSYFDCCWLSDYPNEKELLFMTCDAPLKVVDITNTFKLCNYQMYISALTIIEYTACGNTPFCSDHKITIKVLDAMELDMDAYLADTNPIKFGAATIEPQLKLLTTKLIQHALSRHIPNKYDKYVNIDKYIESLLYNVCDKKEIVIFDWKLMNTDITDKYMNNDGYQGYSFLKYLLFEKKFEMVNLKIVLALFPNAKIIGLTEMPLISTLHLDYVLKYLTNYHHDQSSNLLVIYLEQIESNDNKQISTKALEFLYKNKYNEKGWFISARTKTVLLIQSNHSYPGLKTTQNNK